MARFVALLAELDSDSGRRATQFEHLCRWYLLNAPEYRLIVKRVWLWSEWPDRWGADAGIDLVVETARGELWAIQAKAYHPSYAIKKADVDSFLSESARPHFAYRLLIATTDLLGATARRTLAHQEKPAGLLLRSQLEAEHLDWPASPDDLRPIPQTRKSPLPHQKEAVQVVCAALKNSERGQLIMACGTGKTLVALWIAEQLRSKRTLVLLPSLSLLAQTLREWTANANSPFNYLAVCSDETVAEPDAFVTSTSELGFPVTTEAAAIASFLVASEKQVVVFSTYQSSPRIASAQDDGAPSFDLVVADEAHRCAGQVSSDFATVLDTDRIRGRIRLFMTATPRYFTGRLRREAAQLDVEIASMDDEDHFGPVLHRLGFADAISRDLLSDYQVLVVGVSGAECRELAERGAFITADGTATTDARTLASQLTLLKAMRTYDLRRVVSFHSRVRRARDFSSSLREVIALLPSAQRPSGNLHCDYVSGEMPSGQRDSRLARFRDLDEQERALLANARCLGEGVDIPAIDGVAFIDPRRSQIDIVQAVGRAIRRSPEKKIGTIVLPIFVEDGADPERALEDSSFNNVWDVLKALRAHDDELGEQLDELRRALGRRPSSQGHPVKIRLDLPVHVGDEFIHAFDARLLEETTASWEFWFGLLTRFVGERGHARLQQSEMIDGHRVGAWVSAQRDLFKKGRLADDRATRLSPLPGWSWDPLTDQWEDSFAILMTFVHREGNAHVPALYCEGNFNLGAWVTTQRGRFAAQRLEADRVTRLQALPGWTWHTWDGVWEQAFSRLVEYSQREGTANVLVTHREEDGFPLGRWAARQRTKFNSQSITPDRAARLEKLPGWSWDPNIERWGEGFRHLRAFARERGHTRVAKRTAVNGFALGKWAQTQRTLFKAGQLDSARAAQLEGLPGWSWDLLGDQWDRGLLVLRRYADREGHASPPAEWVEDGFNLGAWVASQRIALRRGRLDRTRAERLTGLRGWRQDIHDDRWEEAFRALQAFVAREGTANVKKRHTEDGIRIGEWVVTQRTAFRNGLLDTSRRNRLESLPGWVWDAFAEKWERSFEALEEFVRREGHARVPQSWKEGDAQLGVWVSHQREAFKLGRIADDRATRLEALPGWSWRLAESRNTP